VVIIVNEITTKVDFSAKNKVFTTNLKEAHWLLGLQMGSLMLELQKNEV